MEFTIREIELLSDGLLSLMGDAWEAIKLVNDDAARDAINEHIRELQKLNAKILEV